MSRLAALLAGAVGATLVGGAARADAPPVPLPATTVACSADRVLCSTIDRRRGTTTMRRGTTVLWTAASAPPAAALSGDGEVIVERWRPGGVLALDDGPATTVFVIRNHGAVVRRIRLADVIARPAALPRSVSLRRWSRVDYFDGDAYVIDTEEGRRVRIALADGTITAEPLPGGTSATWYCRYAQPTTHGPCAGRQP